ncbi:MAG: DUF748 domain-containing protein [Pseudomonadota bacterium]
MSIWNRIPKKTIFFIVFFVIVYTLAGFFAVPELAKKYLPDQASQALGRQVTIQNAAFNPYVFSASIEGLDIRDKEGKTSFFSADSIHVRVSLSSLFRLAPVISEIRVEKPMLDIVREKDGTFNFLDLIQSMSQKKIKTADSSELKHQESGQAIPEFILKNVKISKGEVRFEDKLKAVSHKVSDFSFFLPYLSSQWEKRYEKAGMDIWFMLNQSQTDIHVETTPFAEDMGTRAVIKTQDIHVPHYLAYLPLPDSLKLKTLDINADLDVLFRKKHKTGLLEIQGKVNALDLDLTDTLDAPIIKFEQLSVEILKSDVLSGNINLGTVLLASPDIHITRDEQGLITLMNHIPQTQTVSSDSAIESEEKTAMPVTQSADQSNSAFQLRLALLDIAGASIAFKDLSNAAPFETRVSPMTARFENVTLGKSVAGSYAIVLESESKEIIDSTGQFSINPVAAKGSLTITDVVLNKYAPYYNQQVDLEIETGKLSMAVDFDIRQDTDTSTGIDKLNGLVNMPEMLINALAILDRQSKEKMVQLPEIKIIDSAVDIGQHKVNTGSIKIEPGKMFVSRLKNGSINLVNALQAGSGTRQSSDSPEKQATPIPEPWDVTLPMFDLAGLDLKFQDLTNLDPVNIDLSDINIKASNFQTNGNEKGDLSAQMRWNKLGKISLAGKLLPDKMIGAFDVNLDKIDIQSMQPYFTDAVKVVVTDGVIQTRGKLSMDISDLSTPNIRFVGQSSVSQFVALDKQSAQDFFKATSLYVSGLDVSVLPVKVMIKEVALTDFYSRVIISETGDLNLNSIFTKASTEGDKGLVKTVEKDVKHKEPEPVPSQIKIESVTLQGGEIQFSDYLTRPNFTAGMKELAGAVTGLSSEENTQAKLVLNGIHGQSSPLAITGTINPLAQTKYADIDISFKDIELSSFTPYAAKYLGYKIEKGKLILDLEYNINGKKLKAENRVRFDNFALGESVDSKDATSLPVSLAISLLKNKDGQINLDLPVTGELDDPEFSFGGILFKMIGNLILKVVTSPFSIIGAMFGGGEDLEYLDFKSGDTQISPENFEKIDKLIQILSAKPSVKLEIQGVYDYGFDAQALRLKSYQDLIKTEKIKQMLAKGSTAVALKDITISEEEMPVYVDFAYTKAKFIKPRNADGGEKQIDVEEKKKLLMANILVNQDALRLLSIERAENVKAYILSKNQVDKEQIFIVEPIETRKDEQEKISRVKFLLK